MKKFTLFALSLTLIAILCSCNTKQEAPKDDINAQQAAPTAPVPGDEIFKYTITTDIEADGENIEILVAMNSVQGQYPVKYDLDCEGDGEFEHKGLTDNQKCIYKKNSGKHQIWVRGEIPGMFLCSGAERTASKHNEKAVISVDSWGNVPWKSMESFASLCNKLIILPKDSPDLRQVKDMSFMFNAAFSFNQPLESWDVSNVTNMRFMFSGAFSFNQPLEKWNVSNVTDMNSMFSSTLSFNQPLEKWNVSNVTDMSMMFQNATSFNQPLEKWNVSNVHDMSAMFALAKSFNQPLMKWNVSKVTDMRRMFIGAESFSHYPKNWVVPADDSKDMFKGTKVEAEASQSPLKTR